MKTISLNQRSYLAKFLSENENLKKHFEIDFDTAFEKTRNLSFGQYHYALALLSEKKYSKLNQFLTNLNFKQHMNNQEKSIDEMMSIMAAKEKSYLAIEPGDHDCHLSPDDGCEICEKLYNK